MALITQMITYDSEQNSEENWRRYRATFNNDIEVFIYAPENLRPLLLEAEFIGIRRDRDGK